MTTKPCRDCGEVKPLDEFYKDSKAKDGKQGVCKPCDSVRRKAYKDADPERASMQRHRSKLKLRYGMTVEQYDELLEAQDGRCACCGTTEPGRGDNRFFVDHCHDTGEVRGLLCHKCNAGIGYLGDNVDGVWQAMLYLVKYEQKELVA